MTVNGLAIRKTLKKLSNIFASLFIVMWQASFALAPFIVAPQTAEAATVCVNDTAGANDEPGQKDLTRLCIDDSAPAGTEHVTWNWDKLGTSGANTMDACALFDTDGDGNINYSVCVITEDDPATQIADSPKIYSCGDDKVDRCTSPVSLIAGPYATTCSVSQQNTDPFPTGDSYPADTQADCTLVLSDVGGVGVAELIDVCSYPSQQPNSDPSDCVIIQDRSGKLEVVKDLIPASDSGLFNLQIDAVTEAANVGDGGTTGEVVVDEGNHDVGETAGTSTNLSNYASSIECRNLNGTGSVVASASGATLANVPVADGSDIVCVITNTASSSITIVKDTVPNDGTDFTFTTGTLPGGSFQLDDDSDPTLSSTKAFNGLSAGTYDVAETANSAYTTTATCTDGSPINAIVLTAGENVTCTFVNTKKGHLIVEKTTDPSGDPTVFSINASGTGTITGGGAGTISDSADKDYEVTPGTYSVSETVPDGWVKTGDTCQNVEVGAGQTVRCLITNTKNGRIIITKQTLPDGELQEFGFNASYDGDGFSLSDGQSNDTGYTLAPNQNYSVSEIVPSGWSLTGSGCDDESSVNSISVQPGETVTCTFTNTKLGTISGFKYEVDADGTNESVIGLMGWVIELFDGENTVTDTTDENGFYSFTDLLPGTYTLSEQLQAGYTQIYPDPNSINVELDAGEESEDNNFGNFENVSVSGYKFNDHDGDGTEDTGDERLSGWTINISGPNDFSDSGETDSNGDYSFSDLAPGSYTICEVLQTGWVQTAGGNNPDGCYVIEISESGEAINNLYFGNQGRGTITVIKNVDENADGDTDDEGESNVTNWTWDYSGSLGNGSDIATGSSNSQTVAAGNYNISEDQEEGYHVTDVTCDEQSQDASETASVTVSANSSVTCTFTNTRDSGSITVIKQLDPTDDQGVFDLYVGEEKVADDVGHNGQGSTTVVTGSYTVGELAGTETNLDDYTSTYSCTDGQDGSGTSVEVTIDNDGDQITCTFTNSIKRGSITIIKDAQPNSDQEFGFTGSLGQFTLIDNGTDQEQEEFNDLLPGTYSVTEPNVKGWDLTDISCNTEESVNTNEREVNIQLEPGENVTCTFINEAIPPKLTVIKHVDNTNGNNKVASDFTMHVSGTNVSDPDFPGDENGTTVTLDPGEYNVTEDQLPGYSESFSEDCSGTLELGDEKTCTVTNTSLAPVLNISKTNDQPTPTVVGDTVQYTVTVSVPEDSGTVFGVTVTDLAPDGFVVDNSSAIASQGELTSDYASPGVWTIGDMLPGSTVTLTYLATIASSVTPGEYPDLAFARGFDAPEEGEEVLAACTGTSCVDEQGTAFVGTDVEVAAVPQVLGVNTVLVNTGSPIIMSIIVASGLLLGVLITRRLPVKEGNK